MDTAQKADWSALVVKVAQDECRESFMALFDHFAPRISSYLRQQGLTDDLAEDLSQETMLTLWRKAQQYNPQKAQVSTWVFRIARNLMIDNHRKQRGIAYELDDALLDVSVDDDSPISADASVVQRKIAELPEVQADLVYKSFFEGKSHSEIAKETGQPLGSVKSRLRAAMKFLRQELNPEEQ